MVAVSYLGILSDSYILGDVFLKNWYVTFNFDENMIGLAPNALAPQPYGAQGLTWWAILLICLGALVGLALIFTVVLYFRGRSVMEEHALSSNNKG